EDRPLHTQEQLFAGGAEEAQDDAGGSPITVLPSTYPTDGERGAVEVDVNYANGPATPDANVHAAASLIRNAVRGSGAAAADAGIQARPANQGFRKGSDRPAEVTAIEIARAEMVSVELVLHAADGDEVEAAVADDL